MTIAIPIIIESTTVLSDIHYCYGELILIIIMFFSLDTDIYWFKIY